MTQIFIAILYAVSSLDHYNNTWQCFIFVAPPEFVASCYCRVQSRLWLLQTLVMPSMHSKVSNYSVTFPAKETNSLKSSFSKSRFKAGWHACSFSINSSPKKHTPQVLHHPSFCLADTLSIIHTLHQALRGCSKDLPARAVNLANKQAVTGKFGSSKFQPAKETMICSPQKKRKITKNKNRSCREVFFWVCISGGANTSTAGWKKTKPESFWGFRIQIYLPTWQKRLQTSQEGRRKEGEKKKKGKTASPDLYPAERRRCQEEQLHRFICENESRSIAEAPAD